MSPSVSVLQSFSLGDPFSPECHSSVSSFRAYLICMFAVALIQRYFVYIYQSQLTQRPSQFETRCGSTSVQLLQSSLLNAHKKRLKCLPVSLVSVSFLFLVLLIPGFHKFLICISQQNAVGRGRTAYAKYK